MPLPFQGKVGVYDNFDPTLLPQFYKQVMQANGGLSALSPAAYAAANPQTSASATITVTGTVANGNTVSFTIGEAEGGIGSVTASYTAITGDTVSNVAEGLAAAYNAATAAIPQTEANAVEGVVTVSWLGPVGNSATLSTATSGAIVLTKSASTLSGGSGPVYAANNFNYTWNGCTMSFFYGQPYNLGADLIANMVAAGMPIV